MLIEGWRLKTEQSVKNGVQVTFSAGAAGAFRGTLTITYPTQEEAKEALGGLFPGDLVEIDATKVLEKGSEG